MNDSHDKIMKLALSVSTLGSIFVAIVLVFKLFGYSFDQNAVTNANLRDKAIELAYAGQISDKKIENAYTNIFRTVPAEYRLYIDVKYDTPDGPKTASKYFTVSEDTYLAYDIGDYFDSRNFVAQE